MIVEGVTFSPKFKLLKAYPLNPRLCSAELLLIRHMTASPLKEVIGYHNCLHVAEQLDFFDRVGKEIPLIAKNDEVKFLGRLAIYMHDAGLYTPVGGRIASKGHEQRGIDLVEAHRPELELTTQEMEAVRFLIRMTTFELGESVAQRVSQIDNAILDLSEHGNLFQESSDFLQEVMPSFAFAQTQDKALFAGILMSAKVMAVGDIYGQSVLLAGQMPAYWCELKEEDSPLAQPTILEHMAANYEFMTGFGYQQRLKYFLEGTDSLGSLYGINLSLHDGQKDSRARNISLFLQFRNWVKMLQEKNMDSVQRLLCQEAIGDLYASGLHPKLIGKMLAEMTEIES